MSEPVVVIAPTREVARLWGRTAEPPVHYLDMVIVTGLHDDGRRALAGRRPGLRVVHVDAPGATSTTPAGVAQACARADALDLAVRLGMAVERART